jgi:hypothetical protein
MAAPIDCGDPMINSATTIAALTNTTREDIVALLTAFMTKWDLDRVEDKRVRDNTVKASANTVKASANTEKNTAQ